MTKRVLVAIAAAAIVGGVASAALGPRLAVSPSVLDVHTTMSGSGMGSGSGSGTGTVMNTGDASASVTAIVADGSCAASGVTAFASPAAPFTLPAGMSHTVGIACSATSAFGIRRCQQHVMGGAAVLASYTGLCASEGTSAFAAQTGIVFPPTPVGGASAPMQVMIANPTGNPTSTAVAIQVTDQDGNFRVGSPCLADGPGCDAQVAIAPGGMLAITVTCTPQAMGAHAAQLLVVGNQGTHTAIGMTCTGSTTAATPILSVNPTSVSLAHPVNMGAASTTIHVANIGAADLHISSLTRSGSPDWSHATGGACATVPCTLIAGASFDLTATFTPSQIGARDATLAIASDDPDQPDLQVSLHGTGQGATLALATNLGTPPELDLGTSPIGVKTTATFDLRNTGNVTLDPVDLALSPDDGVLAIMPASTTIAASALRTITVACTPAAATTYDAMLTVTAAGALAGSPLMIAVHCTGTAGDLYATPSALQLGEIRTGTGTVTRTLTLHTAGPPLTISTPSIDPSPDGLQLGTPSNTTITAAAPVTLDVTIDPQQDGDLASTISVTATDTLEIPVTGKIVTAKIAYPTTITVGSFCVGQPTIATAARLTATGTATIGLPMQPIMNRMSSSPFQVGYNTPVAFPYALPAGQVAMVDVTPLRQMIAGPQVDSIVWSTDVADDPSPHTQVTAQFIADGGAIAPQLADFGSVMVRQPSDPKTIKIQNCGSDPMTLAGPSIDPSGDFQDASAGPLPMTLAPLQVATISVGFTPKKAGARTATLSVDSSKGPLSVMLYGLGVADPSQTTGTKSFYGCDCRSSTPGAAAWPVLALALALRRRRRA